MLRPRTTRRFEVITTRRGMVPVMETLARSGAVELEARSLPGMRPLLPQLDGFLEDFAQLEKKYGRYWPPAPATVTGALDDPEEFLTETTALLRNWVAAAEPDIAEHQRLEAMAAELELAAELVSAAGAYPFVVDPEAADQRMSRTIHVVDAPNSPPQAPDNLLVSTISTLARHFIVAMGRPADMAAFQDELGAAKARRCRVPEGLFSQSGDHAEEIRKALDENRAAQARIERRLDDISGEIGLAQVLSRIAVFRWLHENRDEILATERTVRITGWVDPTASGELEQALSEAGLDCVFSLAPEANEPAAPMVLDNPKWLRAFEFFPRLLGIPGRTEADPSLTTALIAPLLFGYMFGDVGQGAVLMVTGLVARRKYPMLAILVPGGAMAMLFGLLFGSVFSREDLLPALWLHPLHDPITVLGASLVLGILLLLVGVALDFAQAVWARTQYRWLRAQGGIVLSYLSLLTVYWFPAAIWGVPLGLMLVVIGARDENDRLSAKAVASALGHYVETLMRLLVSSISFARVGAFALAHAGLSAAVIGIAEAAGTVGYVLVLLLGNILILALEGLVAGIQTTRLILFEFFTRFYHASGREFVPLALPAPTLPKMNGETP